MRIETTFLRSKVARRIFVLFVLCALLPIAGLAIISYRQVSNQLSRQSQSRLRQATKATGMSIFERLLLLEGQMRVIASNAPARSEGAVQTPPKGLREELAARFRGLTLFLDAGREISLLGHLLKSPPELSASEKEHLRPGESLLFGQSSPDGLVHLFMSPALDPGDLGRGILEGETNSTYLWDIGEDSARLPMIELCVLDQPNTVLYCSPDLAASFAGQVARRISGFALGHRPLHVHGQEDVLRARRLSNQVGVALSNA